MLDTLRYIHLEHPWFFSTGAFVLGAIVGSFLNVCIYRIPAGKSVVSPGSTCACGHPIAWYDNIPILSWFILRGRARCCGSPYSFRYPAVEALTGVLFLLAWHAHSPAKAACLMVFAAMLVCGSFIDLDHMEIPNRFSVGLAIVGVALSLVAPTLHLEATSSFYAQDALLSMLVSVIGTLIGSGVILWIALLAETVLKKEAMGFGDVKLLGGIGAFLGWEGAVFAIFGGATLGCAAIVFWILLRAVAPKLRPKKGEGLMGRQVPFGPMLSAGALLYALWLEKPVDAYFEMVASLFQQF